MGIGALRESVLNEQTKALMSELGVDTEHALIDALIRYKTLWEWLPSEVKETMAKVGEMYRCVTRNYKPYFGVFSQPKFALTHITLDVDMPEYDPIIQGYHDEQKTIILPISNVVQQEFIDRREIREHVEGTTEARSDASPEVIGDLMKEVNIGENS